MDTPKDFESEYRFCLILWEHESVKSSELAVRVLETILCGKIIPLYHEDILEEYKEVLHRSKFNFNKETIDVILSAVKQ